MANGPDPAEVDRLTACILRSANYRTLCPAVVRRVVERELARRASPKDAEREARSRLHQIAGAYLGSRPPYVKWLATLNATNNETEYRSELHRMMRAHASTSERLPIIEAFYSRTLAAIRPIRSILDVACGFNPLALPWMGLEAGGRYHACDLFTDAAEFLEQALGDRRFAPIAEVTIEARDIAVAPPEIEAELALVLKLLPLLDQPTPDRMQAWLSGLRTRYALVSFPTRTLGGRNVGMAGSYDARFREVLEGAGWQAERFEFHNELCFLIDFRSAPSRDAELVNNS